MTTDPGGFATASAAVRAAYRTRPHNIRLVDLARIAGFPAYPNVHRMIFRKWAATPLNMTRLQKLAEALGVSRGVALFQDVAPGPAVKK